MAISPDGRWLVTGEQGQDRPALGPQCRRARKDRTRPHRAQEPVCAVAISPDGRWLVTGSYDKTARLWDLKAEEPRRPHASSGPPESCLCRGHQPRRAVAGHRELRQHRPALGPQGRRPEKDRTRPQRATRGLSGPSPSARTAGGWSRGATTKPRGSGTSRPTTPQDRTRPFRATRVLSLPWRSAPTAGGWSPGATTTPPGSGTSRRDDPTKTARVLQAHQGIVTAVAISPDGRWLVTGSYDKTARLWPLTVEELLKQAKRAVGRNFTLEEWNELFPGEDYRKTFEGLPALGEVPTLSR